MKGTAEIFVPYSECCREPKTALQEKKKDILERKYVPLFSERA